MVKKAFCVLIAFLLNNYFFILIFKYFEMEHRITVSFVTGDMLQFLLNSATYQVMVSDDKK